MKNEQYLENQTQLSLRKIKTSADQRESIHTA